MATDRETQISDLGGSSNRDKPLVFSGDLLPTSSLSVPRGLQHAQLIANLECAITSDSAVGEKANHVILPESAFETIANAGFAALSVANNHVLDAGEGAFTDMLNVLDERCDTQVYGTTEAPYAKLSVGSEHCAVVGCIERCRARGRLLFREEHVARLIAKLAQRFSHVYVTPHWGKEGEFAFYPSPRQRHVARSWIAAGATGVFGHHPHVIHGREVVAGRPVFYSLGNFWFPHDEGARYAATGYGMVVLVHPGSASLQVEERFLSSMTGRLLMVKDGQGDLRRWLDALSTDLSRNQWSWVRWAQHVGPIYIGKSARSWRQRFAQPHGLQARLRHVIWCLSPKTLVMRFGSMFPAKAVTAPGDALLEIMHRAEDTQSC